MGSIYDREQTDGIKEIKSELKGSSKINKWILGFAIATFVLVLIQAVVMFSK